MRTIDFKMLTDEETEVVDNSFDGGDLPPRFLNIAIGTTLAVCVAVGAYALGASAGAMATIAVFLVVMNALEKYSYARSQLVSRSVIRKLVRRVEGLEGVPLSSDTARPSRHAVDTSRAA